MRCELSAENLTQLRSEHSCSGGADLSGKPFAGHLWQRAIRPFLFVAFLPLFVSQALSQSNEQPYFGVAIRKALVEERFSRQRIEQEPVSTSLMNTSVTGMQSTVTETRLRFIPDQNLIRFELLNSGDVTSRTTGINRQAMVDSTGQHHFDVVLVVAKRNDVVVTAEATVGRAVGMVVRATHGPPLLSLVRQPAHRSRSRCGCRRRSLPCFMPAAVATRLRRNRSSAFSWPRPPPAPPRSVGMRRPRLG